MLKVMVCVLLVIGTLQACGDGELGACPETAGDDGASTDAILLESLRFSLDVVEPDDPLTLFVTLTGAPESLSVNISSVATGRNIYESFLRDPGTAAVAFPIRTEAFWPGTWVAEVFVNGGTDASRLYFSEANRSNYVLSFDGKVQCVTSIPEATFTVIEPEAGL